jgi:hypothetical protein
LIKFKGVKTMQIIKESNPNANGWIYNVFVAQEECIMLENAIRTEVVELVARQITNDILSNNYNEILSKISPEAIANMAIAEAGAAVNETLHKKLPDKILEIHKTDTRVYQRGLLGRGD